MERPQPGFALARQTDAGTVLDAGGNVDLEVLFLPGPAGAATDLAGILITRPAPWQDGQVRSIVKKPCWARTLPMPPQVGQEIGWVPDSAPDPEQPSQTTEVGTRTVA